MRGRAPGPYRRRHDDRHLATASRRRLAGMGTRVRCCVRPLLVDRRARPPGGTTMPLRRITLIALTAAAALAAVGAGPPAADAATTCRFANDVVEVHMTQHRDHALLRATAGPIDIDGPAGPVACSGGTPTTSN